MIAVPCSYSICCPAHCIHLPGAIIFQFRLNHSFPTLILPGTSALTIVACPGPHLHPNAHLSPPMALS
ncbi:unnamed protein product [Protopolystoma xenopodis]|uniref:Uncharacterized protein n=1 Tax=Protopolystoma xenopodis TaxID=117903 RepID=A0A3S5C5X6_9PLAT|nr:unnamed protein product [Protopolystoma xenopodis]